MEFKIGLLLTTKVTGKVCGELPAPAEVMVTFSMYVPGPRAARTAGLIAKLNAWGVVPEAGLAWRKLGPPLTGVAAAVKLTPAVELVIWTFCAAGVPLPI